MYATAEMDVPQASKTNIAMDVSDQQKDSVHKPPADLNRCSKSSHQRNQSISLQLHHTQHWNMNLSV